MIDQLLAAGGVPMSEPVLTEAERNAMQTVRTKLGKRPRLDDYVENADSRYSVAFTRAMTRLTFALLIALIIPSAVRLFNLGYGHAGGGATEGIQWVDVVAFIIGISTVIGAEVGAVLFMVAARTLATDRASRFWLRTAAVFCVIFAYVGNYTAILANAPSTAFNVLDTVIFPTLVLLASLVLENLFLENDQKRQEAKKTVADLQALFDRINEDPTQSEQWRPVFYNAIWEAYRNANARGVGRAERIEILQTATRRDKIEVVEAALLLYEWTTGVGKRERREPVLAIQEPADPVREQPQEPVKNTENGTANGHGKPVKATVSKQEVKDYLYSIGDDVHTVSISQIQQALGGGSRSNVSVARAEVRAELRAELQELEEVN